MILMSGLRLTSFLESERKWWKRLRHGGENGRFVFARPIASALWVSVNPASL